MNIYIYGTSHFKKEMHKTLIDSNIKLKLGANNLIKEVESLNALKEIITENPKEIFLIDSSKIITKNSFAKKIKFLTPKDGIEEEFLLDRGIADLSVDSLEEIPKYILKKYEQEKGINDENSFLEDNLNMTKQDIMLDDNFFVDTEENITVNKNNVDFSDNIGLNNISFNYYDDNTINDTCSSLDDEELLKNLMSISNNTFEDNFEDNPQKEEHIENEVLDITKELELDNLLTKIKETKQEKKEATKEVNMENNNFSELDFISEKDLLDALNIEQSVQQRSFEKPIQNSVEILNNNEVLNISSSNLDELAKFFSKILNNKTLEITIKIKD